MDKKDIVRAWRDPDYYQSLTDAERAVMPDHPAGIVELSDRELNGVTGGEVAVITGQIVETVCVTIAPGDIFCSIRLCDD